MNNIYELPLTKFTRRLAFFYANIPELADQLLRIANMPKEELTKKEQYWILEAAENLIHLHKDCLQLIEQYDQIKRGYNEH